jgi:hypothetical protein
MLRRRLNTMGDLIANGGAPPAPNVVQQFGRTYGLPLTGGLLNEAGRNYAVPQAQQ